MPFSALPDAIIEHVAELVPPTRLPTLALVELRCRDATVARLLAERKKQALERRRLQEETRLNKLKKLKRSTEQSKGNGNIGNGNIETTDKKSGGRGTQ